MIKKIILVLTATLLVACQPDSQPEVFTEPITSIDQTIWKHYNTYKIIMPSDKNIKICSGHHCAYQHDFKISLELISEVTSIMSVATDAASERAVLKKAIAIFEKYAGEQTGTSGDKESSSPFESGDPTQMDTVDEATNTTSYLLTLYRHGLIKFHNINHPVYWQGKWMRPYFGAVITETATNQKFVIDSHAKENGKEPVILIWEQWKK